MTSLALRDIRRVGASIAGGKGMGSIGVWEGLTAFLEAWE
jgi:hypothetical protein